MSSKKQPNGHIEIHEAVGSRIKAIRGDVYQHVFAAKLGISTLSLQRYEYGYRVPPGDVLQKLSDVSGKSIDWILTGKESGEGLACENSPLYLDKAESELIKQIRELSDKDREMLFQIIDRLKKMEV